MMELGDEIRVKTLRERFQNESSPNQMKPAIPEKPKMLPPINSTTKISSPLITSINSAIENRLAPRVVFRDYKKTQPSSQPETSEIKATPILLDKNQKKEADLIKQALRDKTILPISPVKPDFEKISKIESIQKSPGLETLVKVPKPVRTAILNSTDKDENEKTHFSKWNAPASSFLESSDSNKAKPDRYYKPVLFKALVPPVQSNPTISSQAITSPGNSPLKSPTLMVPESVLQKSLHRENLRPEIPLRLNSHVTNPKTDIFSDGLPEDEESPDFFHSYIPPPIIPEDFTENGTFQHSPDVAPEPSFSQHSDFPTPVSHSPALFRTSSPIQPVEIPDANPVFTFSPPPVNVSPSMLVESLLQNKVTESPRANSYTENFLEVPIPTSPMAASVASALARAEELAPVKHNACDQRLLKLLEKSKQKSSGRTQSSTPDTLPIFDADLSNHFLQESSPLETVYAKPVSHVDVQPGLKTLENLSDFPLVEYKSRMEKTETTEFNTLSREKTLNDQDNIHSVGKSSNAPKTVVIQRPLVPPPPPPRKPQLSVPNGALTPVKLPPTTPSENIKSTILSSLPLEYKEQIFQDPTDFTSDDTTFPDPSELVGSLNVSPELSVHQKVIFDHLDLKHQTPNIDIMDTPRPLTPDYSDSVPNSVSSSALPSPTGKQNNYSLYMVESTGIKKAKAQKKQRKGSPMNPYADTSVVTDEIPKKTLFSRNSIESNDKELKVKQKLKDKDKDKKEQKDKKKEKDREKKELKEKEKKENEIKKKFRITGEEEALYQAKVIETMKGRKDDLAIKAGEIVSVIRITDCPKGKWLARDRTNKYGYIPVESVELNIQEMMLLRNKGPNINGVINPLTSSTNTIMNQESFEDDSEEWGDDENDTVFPTVPTTNIVLNQQIASPNIVSKPDPVQRVHTENSDDVHGGREAVHKLTTFFAQPTVPLLQKNTAIKEPAPFAMSAQEPVNFLKEEIDLHILPPPDSYADIVVG